MRLIRSNWSRYAMALVVTAAALLMRAMLDPVLGDMGPLILSTVAILIAALVGGFGPGMVAMVLGAVLAMFLFMEPRYEWSVADPHRQAYLVVYGLLGVFFSLVGELHLRRAMRLRESREVARHNEDRYRTLFKTIQDGFCIVKMMYDDAGKPIDYLIVEGNPSYAEHTGLQDSVGKTIREVEPNIEPYWIETYGRIVQTGQPERFENYVKAWDRWFDVYAYRFGDPANDEVAIFFKDISSRKRAEMALAAANQRIDAGLMAGEVATYTWDIKHDQLNGDQNFVRMFGVLKDEHESAPLSEFMKVVHPDDVPHVRDALNATLERNEPYEVEYRIVNRSASAAGGADASNAPERWVLVRGRIVERSADGTPILWSGVLMDITDRKRVEQALRESEKNFRSLADNIPQLAWMTDATGWIFWYNQRWFEYTGTTLEEMQGWGWQKVHDPAHVERVAEMFRQHIKTGETWEDTFPLRSKDGEYRWFLSRAFPIRNERGEVVHWFGTNTDITELRELDQRKDQFLAVLSHELRNPLAAIRMASQLLKTNVELPADAENLVGTIDRQTTQLVRLVDDLLDMSRITRGTFELRKQVVGLDTIMHRALEVAQPSMDCHAVTLKVHKPEEPLLVDADPLRLSQVFANLINNACKYSKPGAVVDIFIDRSDSAAAVRVCDYGVGIPGDRLEGIFEMFAQVDPERDRRTGGLGIGLALARGIVLMHGGTIEARSEGPEKGSEFIVRLPIALPREQAAVITDNGQAAQPRRTIEPRRILAVDDNVDALQGLAGVLRSAGHDVLTAEDGQSALSLAANHKPHAALLDIGMPGMDGYELAQRIRSTSWGRDITLIALTGWGQEKDKHLAAEAGFNAHLTKPADLETIERALGPG